MHRPAGNQCHGRGYGYGQGEGWRSDHGRPRTNATVGGLCQLDAEEDGPEDDEEDPDRMRARIQDLVEDAVAAEDEAELDGLDELQLLAHVE